MRPVLWMAISAVPVGAVTLGQVAAPSVHSDVRDDATALPSDPGTTLPSDTHLHRLPDIGDISMGRWSPHDAVEDLFSGQTDEGGVFLRLELTFRGLVNPPGSADPFAFSPFRYGDHPVYGFVEIDIDGDVDTGGELEAPEYRYLGTVVRFGGNVLREEFRDRAAEEGSAFDGDFETPPYVERHGEEFHLALLGTQFDPSGIEEINGNGDLIFDDGETWNIRGRFFHRAHGFELFSFVEGGRHPGEYAPRADLQFRHDPTTDATYVVLVFPLTNEGAALMRSEPPEPANQDPTDHVSILEGLEDLQLSAFFLPILPTGLPEEAIIANWAERDPRDHLDPGNWTLTAVFGSSFTQPDASDVYYLWSDIYPNVVYGDVDGSGAFDGRDRQLIARAISERDILDGVPDGVVTILDFAEDFSVFDVNHDGVIDGLDLAPPAGSGDGDEDGDVDLFDFAILQRCFDLDSPVEGECRHLDAAPDLTIDLTDLAGFHDLLVGPIAE